MATYSVLIKGGMVAREKKLERLDVGIKDDKIEAVGDLSGSEAPLIVEASGKCVAPGFIDLTSHSDTHWTLFSQPSQESLVRQGITTILGGNCGSSLAPLVKAGDISGIQKWTDIRGVNVNWQRLSEFFDELERHPLGVNFATLVGHGTLRRGVVGDEARPATKEEIDQMRLLLSQALEEGAFGLSTSLGAAHGRSAGDDELLGLFNVTSLYSGFTKHHLKDEGKNILPAMVQLIQYARDSQVPVQFSHFKVLGRQVWPIFDDTMRLIEEVREEGLSVTLDMFPYTRTGTPLYQLLPPWILEGGKEKILASLRDETMRKDVISYLRSLTLHYERVTVASTRELADPVGKTIQELGARAELPPEEIILELLLTSELTVSIFNEVISPEHIEKLIKKEYTMLASDGVGYQGGAELPYEIPHPRSFGSYPRAMALFSREKNILSLGELVYKMTEFPSRVSGLKERGKIQKGFFADVVVLDPEMVQSSADWGNPTVFPEGIEWVFVNGKKAVEKGELSGNLAGRILRKR